MTGLIFGAADNYVQFADKVGGAREVFEGQPKVLVGGCTFNISQMPAYPNVLPAATPIYVDEVARTIDIHYAFGVYEAANASTTIKVKKGFEGSRIKVGMNIMKATAKVATTGTAVTVTAVDTTDPAFDVVTVDSALTLTLTDVIWEADKAGTGAKVKVVPNALTDRDKRLVPGSSHVNGATIFMCDGAILENRIPPVSDAIKLALKENDCFFRYTKHQ